MKYFPNDGLWLSLYKLTREKINIVFKKIASASFAADAS